jgi:hypothetical protein
VSQSAYGHDNLNLAAGYGYRPDVDQVAARSLLFAGTILGLIGVTNLVQSVSVLAGSKVYPDNAVFITGSSTTWGWVVLAAGIVELIASFAIFTRSTVARTIGIAVAAGNAVTQLLVMPARPLWGLAAVAADVLVIKALVVHGKSAPLS